MLKVHLGPIESPSLVCLDHSQQVIDVSIVTKILVRSIIVHKFQIEFVPLFGLNFLDFDFFEALEQLGNQGGFLNFVLGLRHQLGRAWLLAFLLGSRFQHEQNNHTDKS